MEWPHRQTEIQTDGENRPILFTASHPTLTLQLVLDCLTAGSQLGALTARTGERDVELIVSGDAREAHAVHACLSVPTFLLAGLGWAGGGTNRVSRPGRKQTAGEKRGAPTFPSLAGNFSSTQYPPPSSHSSSHRHQDRAFDVVIQLRNGSARGSHCDHVAPVFLQGHILDI